MARPVKQSELGLELIKPGGDAGDEVLCIDIRLQISDLMLAEAVTSEDIALANSFTRSQAGHERRAETFADVGLLAGIAGMDLLFGGGDLLLDELDLFLLLAKNDDDLLCLYGIVEGNGFELAMLVKRAKDGLDASNIGIRHKLIL